MQSDLLKKTKQKQKQNKRKTKTKQNKKKKPNKVAHVQQMARWDMLDYIKSN